MNYIAFAAFALPAALAAQSAAPPKGWGGTIDLGYVSSTGNTNVTTLSIGEKLGWHAPRGIAVAQTLRSIYGKTEDSVTANSLVADIKADYVIIGGVGVTVGAGYERNRFAGIDRRLDESVGLVWKFASSHADSLRVESGIVWTQQINIEDVETDFTSLRFGFWYKRPIHSASYFQETFEALPNLDTHDDYRINSETAIVAPISKRIGLKFAYVVKYDNLPEPTFEKTDKIMTAGVQISY